MKKIIPLVIFCVFFAANTVLAHQPRLIKNNDIVIIKNPEISQAFYSNLNGQPQYFQISKDADFNLYLNILSPDIVNARKDFSVGVYDGLQENSEKIIYQIDGPMHEWQYFYEEFGGDGYWQGPEIKVQAKAGDYLIKVYNSDNIGKYSLAVGEIESFPPSEIWNTLVLLPQLKSQIFDKSPLMAYFNRIGEFLGIFIVGIIFIVFAIIKFLKRKK